VGNLSFYTSELQIQETMSIVGPIKRMIMGLNKNTKTPCGFCFVEYFTHEHAVECLKFINQSKCDDRVIKCELDGGFHEGRQYGRGVAGGQIRDEKRTTPDVGRGSIVMPGGVTSSTYATMNSSLGKRGSDRGDRGGSSSRYKLSDRDRGGRDSYGRDSRPAPPPPPPPTDANGALNSQRRPPPPPRPPATEREGGSTGAEERGRRDEEEEREGSDERPRKNPRFRDAEDADGEEEE
jgi:hypothetical protein